jgi:hypothetical protein
MKWFVIFVALVCANAGDCSISCSFDFTIRKKGKVLVTHDHTSGHTHHQ